MNKEITGIRDLSFSAWHRKHQICRFVDYALANEITMIDVDACEYCRGCGRILALIETTVGDRSKSKCTSVLERLAKQAGVPAYLVRYEHSTDTVQSTLENGEVLTTRDISRFHLQNLPGGTIETLDPAQFARWLLQIHMSCVCGFGDDYRRLHPTYV